MKHSWSIFFYTSFTLSPWKRSQFHDLTNYIYLLVMVSNPVLSHPLQPTYPKPHHHPNHPPYPMPHHPPSPDPTIPDPFPTPFYTTIRTPTHLLPFPPTALPSLQSWPSPSHLPPTPCTPPHAFNPLNPHKTHPIFFIQCPTPSHTHPTP